LIKPDVLITKNWRNKGKYEMEESK